MPNTWGYTTDSMVQVSASFAGRNVDREAWQTVFNHYLEVVIAQKYVIMLNNLRGIGCVDINDSVEAELSSQILSCLDPESSVNSKNLTLDYLIIVMQKKLDNVFRFINSSALSTDVRFIDYVLPSGRLIFGLPKIIQNSVTALQGKKILVLLDEYENLRLEQQKIVNTLIKHTELPVTFRVGTRIYGIKTYETLIDGEFLMVDADYRQLFFESVLNAKQKDYGILLKKIAEKRLEQVDEFKKAHLTSITELLGSLSPEKEALQVVYGKDVNKDSIEHPIEEYANKMKHVIEMKNLLQERYPSNYNELLLDLLYPKNPLLEMLNLLLLRRKYEASKVKALFQAYVNKNNDNQFEEYKNLYDKNKLALLFPLISLNRPVQKKYAGFNIYRMLSSGIIRNFMELCYQSFNIAIFEENEEIIKKRVISLEIQTKGARTRAERFIEVIERIPEYGKEIKSLLFSIGAILKTWQLDPRLAEPEVAYFCIDTTSLSERGKRVIDVAVQWSVLQQKAPMKGKSPNEPLKDVYALNHIFAPYFGISYRIRGRKAAFSKKDLETLMFGSDEEKQIVINKIVKTPPKGRKVSLMNYM